MIDDEELLSRFRASRLDEFPHEFHVRVGYLLARERGETAGGDEFMRGLRALAARFGLLPSMLHVTRTRAWMRLIAASIQDPAQSSLEFLAAHPDLRRKDLLTEYYSWGRLNSIRARRRFVDADRRPLPLPASGAAGAA
jgi:hypothetical protein